MIEYKVRVYEDRTEWINQDDKLHRIDGPAVERSNGVKLWFKNGKRHRLDGPAVEGENGSRGWYIEGRVYSKEEFDNKIREMNNSCEGKIVEVDGKKYKLVEV